MQIQPHPGILLPNQKSPHYYAPRLQISPLCQQNIKISYIPTQNKSLKTQKYKAKDYQHIRIEIQEKVNQPKEKNKNKVDNQQLDTITKNIRNALSVINKYDGNMHIVRANQPFQNNCLLSYYEVELCGKQQQCEVEKKEKVRNEDEQMIEENLQIGQIQQKPKQSNKQANKIEQSIWNGLIIGLTPNSISKSDNLMPVPGKINNSIGIRLPSSIYQNNQKIDQLSLDGHSGLKTGDIIGIGLIHHKQQIFITLNGNQLHKNTIYFENPQLPILNSQPATLQPLQFYPTICLSNPHQKLSLKFQNNTSNFKYNYNAKIDQLTSKLQYKISLKSQANQSHLYSMVHDYLRFHGYSNSSFQFEKQMMKKNIKFTVAKFPKNKFTFHTLVQEQLKIREDEGKQEQEKKRNQNMKTKQKNKRKRNKYSDDQMEEYLHFGDSDYQESDPSTPSEEENQEEEYTFEVFMRRKDYLPPEMRTKKNHKIEHPMQRRARRQKQKAQKQLLKQKQRSKIYAKQKQKILDDRERNIRLSRTSVLKQIRMGKLEVALRMFIANILEIYRNTKYLQIYFKAHIFLKKYKTNGLNIALQYLKQIREQICKYQNNLFPFYNPQSKYGGEPYILKPLKHLFLLIITENSEIFDLENQLIIFADFVDKIICEKIGYLGLSKLEYSINHFELVKQICDRNKVPCTERGIIMNERYL